MNRPAHPFATYADIEALPPNIVGEIIDGTLLTHPRPSPRHAVASFALGGVLTDPFQRGSGGPRGWVFSTEPELHLGSDFLVPDVAGWRRERLSAYPETNYFETAPDWTCEILSASTERHDRGRKRQIYGESGVRHLWLIDPRLQILEVFELESGRWVHVRTWNSEDIVSAPPFEAISFPLADLWPLDRPLGFAEDPQPLFAGDR